MSGERTTAMGFGMGKRAASRTTKQGDRGVASMVMPMQVEKNGRVGVEVEGPPSGGHLIHHACAANMARDLERDEGVDYLGADACFSPSLRPAYFTKGSRADTEDWVTMYPQAVAHVRAVSYPESVSLAQIQSKDWAHAKREVVSFGWVVAGAADCFKSAGECEELAHTPPYPGAGGASTIKKRFVLDPEAVSKGLVFVASPTGGEKVARVAMPKFEGGGGERVAGPVEKAAAAVVDNAREYVGMCQRVSEEAELAARELKRVGPWLEGITGDVSPWGAGVVEGCKEASAQVTESVVRLDERVATLRRLVAELDSLRGGVVKAAAGEGAGGVEGEEGGEE